MEREETSILRLCRRHQRNTSNEHMPEIPLFVCRREGFDQSSFICLKPSVLRLTAAY